MIEYLQIMMESDRCRDQKSLERKHQHLYFYHKKKMTFGLLKPGSTFVLFAVCCISYFKPLRWNVCPVYISWLWTLSCRAGARTSPGSRIKSTLAGKYLPPFWLKIFQTSKKIFKTNPKHALLEVFLLRGLVPEPLEHHLAEVCKEDATLPVKDVSIINFHNIRTTFMDVQIGAL